MQRKKQDCSIDWTKLTLPKSIGPSRKIQLVDKQPIVHLRDGEVVLYKRRGTRRWQCRYKLREQGWIHATTGTASTEDAAARACELYDEARFRQRMGLAAETKRYSDVAASTVKDMRAAMAAGIGKRVYADYCAVITQYLVPYFGKKYLQNITAADVAGFEVWRNEQMQRTPAKSTLLTFAAAWRRVHDTAINKGWISEHTAVPRLTILGGARAKSRPAFTAVEVVQLRHFMQHWAVQPMKHTKAEAREMRLLLRDYVELLTYTGIRHGTEAMRIQWRHCEWHWDGDVRYLRIWVSGKTGERWLIAKHEAVSVLERLRARDVVCAALTLDEVLAARKTELLFRFSTGQQPYAFNSAFKRLLSAAGLLQDGSGETRTLYSLRHTYATMELAAGTDIHTLARQMGTSVLMLERYYSKVSATLMASELA